MTKTQIDQRITDFEKLVNRHAKKISEIGNASWDPIKESTETPAIRAFLTKKGAGIDYLNMKIARLLSTNGRVVKFAGLFLHGTPMVRGWKRTKSGTKQPISGDCELADLMTVFLYVDSNKTIKRMRSVMFQAKKNASKRGHIVDDPEQRKLYDECEGFNYCNESISKKETVEYCLKVPHGKRPSSSCSLSLGRLKREPSHQMQPQSHVLNTGIIWSGSSMVRLG